MISNLFLAKNRRKIEKTVIRLLNDNQLMNKNTVDSPRAVGDAVQVFLENNISHCLPKNIVTTINTSFARRSMADLAFDDTFGNYYVVDVKTHNLTTNFSMPNITSVERLARFFGDSKNYFVLLIISYTPQAEQLLFKKCLFVPIEYLDWSCLTLGALGWGQIQIANSNVISIDETNTRKKWMLQLCDAIDVFYPNEISKIKDRINYFKKIREYWENHPD
jgi:hypothetical protein